MLITIVVPVYNAEKFLPRCIDSLVSQTYRNLEILLVIDDSSSDQSSEICERYAGKDPRIRVFHKNKVGVSVARNQGIRAANGTYLMFVDADDFVDPQIVEMLKTAVYDNDAGLAVCMYKTVFFQNDQSSTGGFTGITEGMTATDQYLDICSLNIDDPASVREKAHVIGNIWGRLYLTEIIRSNNHLFNTELNRYEDVLFNVVYLSFIKNLCIVNADLYNYCVYQGHVSLSERVVKNKFEMIVLSYGAIRACYGSRPFTYIKYFYSYLLVGHIIRLFQPGSPYSFCEAVSEVKRVCLSETYKEVMVYYRIPCGASTLIPVLLKKKLFLLASVVAKLRMVHASLKNEPIRKWCFTPKPG